MDTSENSQPCDLFTWRRCSEGPRDTVRNLATECKTQFNSEASPYPQVSLEAAMLGGRVTQKRDRQSNRSQLDRLNKCKTSPGQHKLRRSDRQHSSKNSNANNNRKCSQRMC